MKKTLFFLIMVVLTMSTNAQIAFENGYFISNDDQRVSCLIKNHDWKNNPNSFEYQLTSTGDVSNKDISEVKEFAIGNSIKFIRAKVNIDRSSENVQNISETISPIFKEEELFLKVLIEGAANLYYYEDGNLRRYFYSKSDGNIEQLIYKSFLTKTGAISQNNNFRLQLLRDLSCESIAQDDVMKVRYRKSDLMKLFLNYNACSNIEVVNYTNKEKRDKFNLNIRPGVNYATLKIWNNTGNSRNVDFGSDISMRLGLEAEFFLPFNKNKWAFIVEPTYQSYHSHYTDGSLDVTATYKSIELPFGVRYYSFLNEKSALFFNASYVLDFSFDSSIKYKPNNDLVVETLSNFALGVGYKFHDKMSFEFRSNFGRDILNSYKVNRSEYNSYALVFAYTLL